MSTIVFLPNPVPLQCFKRYRARITLGMFEAPFASAGAVCEKFQSLGFQNVLAFKNHELPPDWPVETTQGVSSKNWWVEGTWRGADSTIDKPEQVDFVWEA